MLQSLHVKNFALIDEIEVEFKNGLNILTGETGAGKSIILGSINLALGGRYTADLLRKGADYGLVELAFFVEQEKQCEELKALDIYPDDGMVILTRRLMEGRSVSRINGETVSISRLKEAASILIDIHGQHEHQSLLYKKNHLAIVDMFARDKIEPVKQKILMTFGEYQACKKELEQANLGETERLKEIDFLNYEIREIEEASLKEGEDEELEEQYRKMTHGKKIAEGIAEAYGYTAEEQEQNASDLLSRAIRALQEVTDYDEKAEQLLSQLVDVDALLNDFNRELSDYGKEFEFSPEEFYETENRLNEVNRMKAKYGDSISAILEYWKEKEDRLTVLQDYDSYLESLKGRFADAEEQLAKYSTMLTKERKKGADKLAKLIGKGLLELNFLEVNFQIRCLELPEYTANGKDELEFLISMNPGEPVKPLGDVASGGELSRIMLAIKTVLADKDSIETLIFDEIDSGISGRTAQKVSEKMAVIGQKHQVICITHLAQIAAMADAHYAIEKHVEKDKTKTEIHLLDEKQEIEELARILGGAKITETVIQNALEMKELAKNTKI